MNPEELARRNLDEQLIQAGWRVRDHPQMNLHAGRGVAVRESMPETGEGKVIVGLRRAGSLRQAILKRAFDGRPG
jgi:hypothetical protein